MPGDDDLEIKTIRLNNVALLNQKISQLLGYNFSKTCELVKIMKERYRNGFLAQIKIGR